MKLRREAIIYLVTFITCFIGLFFISDRIFYTPFTQLALSFKFDIISVVGSLLALFVTRKQSNIDLIFSIPLILLAFASQNIPSYLIFAVSFFSIAKLNNIKFLGFVALNLIALLVFKENVELIYFIIVMTSFVMISLSKKNSIFLTLFLIKYISLINFSATFDYSLQIIIPFVALLLIYLYFKQNLVSSLNILSFAVLVLNPNSSVAVTLTCLCLLGLAELITLYSDSSFFVLVSNIVMFTIVLSVSFFTGQATLLPLIVLLTAYSLLSTKKVEVVHAA